MSSVTILAILILTIALVRMLVTILVNNYTIWGITVDISFVFVAIALMLNA